MYGLQAVVIKTVPVVKASNALTKCLSAFKIKMESLLKLPVHAHLVIVFGALGRCPELKQETFFFKPDTVRLLYVMEFLPLNSLLTFLREKKEITPDMNVAVLIFQIGLPPPPSPPPRPAAQNESSPTSDPTPSDYPNPNP